MEQLVLKASRRTNLGTKHACREREAGRLPAIIYGHGEDPEPISLDAHDALLELQHGARVFNLELDGKQIQYLVKDVQYDYLDTNPLHVDLMRVKVGEKVHVKVGVELRGTPEGIAEGGVLDHPVSEVDVECLITQIPETIVAGVKHLKVGEALLAKDLELPAGVTLLTDPEERIAAVRVLAEEIVEEEAGEEAEQPEVIGRAKEEEGPEKEG
ncbi:MAG: 50S ribosomal protein L25 [Phycisphaerae bacterium]|nr:50S ribosomal protein L25 [Phycisphaerae bacterium]